LDFCKKFDIVVTAYSSLARGSDHPELLIGDSIDIFKDEVLIEIANSHKKSVA